MKRVTALLGALAVAMAAGCAHMRDEPGVCSEYRGLRCATATECSMDQRRGCRVCACSSGAPADQQSGRLQSMVPPDRRTPQQ